MCFSLGDLIFVHFAAFSAPTEALPRPSREEVAATFDRHVHLERSLKQPSTAIATFILILDFHGNELSFNHGFGERRMVVGVCTADAHEGGKILAFVPKKEFQSFSRIIGDFDYSWFHL
jgi:hypothetical protein